MEVLKITIFFAIVLMAMAMVQRAAADSHSPAPSPASDAVVFTPALFASITALVFGFFFC
ncbi:hypothetical protein AAC387_Pa02g2942 [Persea americana]